MDKIYVVGHKNPDTDSICSAYAYANLKNIIDDKSRYIPVRCGNLNPQVRFVFDNINDEPPIFLKDIYPKVKDIMTCDVIFSNENDPIFDAVRNLENLGIRLTPVVKENRYLGVVSILEISKFFIPVDIGERPKYLIRPENFKKILPGEFIKKCDMDEFEAFLMIGAMPYDTFVSYVEGLPSKNTLLIVGKRDDFIKYAIKNNFPGVIVTGIKDERFDFDCFSFSGFIYKSNVDTAETLRRVVFSTPIKSIMTSSVLGISPEVYAEEAKNRMITENHRGLPVVEDGKLVGIITRSDLLKDKRQKLILMDHNEISQAIDGAEIGEIVEIVDHHRLGTLKTKTPVYFYAKPVGSTCTLVYQQYLMNGVKIDKKYAFALLSGILSDTVVLKSPTVTDEDVKAVHGLAHILDVDYINYGKKMFEASSNLKGRSLSSIITADFKIYEDYGFKIGVSQVETVNLNEINDIKYDLIDELKNIATKQNLNWATLLVTDIIEEKSILLTSGFNPIEDLIVYKKIEENTYDLPGVLSRKKQLLPEILRVLELLSKK